MGFDRNASRRFAGLATLTVLVFGGPAAAQTFDHLACFKTKDSTKASATVDLAALQAQLPDEQDCKIKLKAREFCVPAAEDTATGSETSADDAIVGSDLANDFLCYKVKCKSASADPPATLDLIGPFATRQLSRFKGSTVCAPALKACGSTNAPACGGYCPDAQTCGDGGGTCVCS